MEYINKKRETEVSCDNSLHHSRFKTTLSFLRMAGIPINNTSLPKVYTLYHTVSVLCYYSTCACALMDTYVHRHDLIQAMKKTRVAIVMCLSAWMHLSLSYRKREIEHLFSLTDSFTWEELPTRDPDTGYLTKAGYIPIIQRLTKYTAGSAASFYYIQSTVRMASNHELIYTSWFPLDISATAAYVFANIIQAIASLLATFIAFGFPSLYATLVCVSCSQLEKLSAALKDIRQTHILNEQDSGGETEHKGSKQQTHTSNKVFQHMQKQLNVCIRHHQQIKRFMAVLENTMNLPLCGLFLLFLSAMCLDAFCIVTNLSDVTDVLLGLAVYIVLTGSLYVYSWLGDELSTHAEMVTDAAWGCDWVGTPVPFQRSLAFIIAAANKEFTLTAGKFAPVCNKTMMNMINQSISFFMFLLHVKDKHAENSQPV